MNPAAVKAELAERMRAKDIDGTLELIADDAVYFWSNGSAMFGKAAVALALAANFDGIEDDTYDVYDLTWLAESDDVAACAYGFEWTGRVDGRLVGGSGRGTSVLRCGDGGWQVVQEHLSPGDWR